ncbi:MAG: 50S ribosomal protein L23 [Candidatus Levybacteria bacterium RIFCSPLOWO2_02_FULL_37_10]|nr:MAG: 50S ribosomal protein L23 [Candidatus Levybacteria bacterium RIFCSPHIGHO2_01_FULL_37_33]OGH17494.1 MAG: 50S ribosomal protein L23 [Candidatus Levybacteria bacterium RIFCSPHIGHO2_02_FULL_37_11]OGH29406.1 MAG: 50S ribosomal protein L23 [Candidatus Levybacteria bacterium RIFCSPHIGHO2_12_FULL_37_12]OGH32914.1 MAG: 50S ribosomal protein L23 [Candidatus Levybacteria bacterium RIFCSPLOWO2_01_FULL_36_54]OGH43296.1 MAG: 50S ribosomal protein L23 [Candidatus Levybacteria bacterium RIFCSPLOWO2_02_
MNADVIISPLISEKSMNDVNLGKFTFKVFKKADKNQIKKEVENKFKVNVLSIATATVKGKKRRVGAKRTEVALSSWKKAIVKLKTGQKIDLFDVAVAQKS